MRKFHGDPTSVPTNDQNYLRPMIRNLDIRRSSGEGGRFHLHKLERQGQ